MATTGLKFDMIINNIQYNCQFMLSKKEQYVLCMTKQLNTLPPVSFIRYECLTDIIDDIQKGVCQLDKSILTKICLFWR